MTYKAYATIVEGSAQTVHDFIENGLTVSGVQFTGTFVQTVCVSPAKFIVHWYTS